MKTLSFALVSVACLIMFASNASSQTITKVVQGDPKPINDRRTLISRINATEASLSSTGDARAFIDSFLQQFPAIGRVVKPDDKNFYCIIHVMRWKDLDASNKQVVDKQNYYVYHSGNWSDAEFSGKKRIYGVNEVFLLFIHLNKDPRSNYQARYEFKITRKDIAPVSHLFQLASIFATGLAAAGVVPEEDKMVWGGEQVAIPYNPSDIALIPKITTAQASYQPLDDSQVIDNEGRYHFDFSVGIPIRRISQLNFDSVGNTVSAKKVDKQNVYALFNYYFRPVDVKEPSFSLIPYFVGGVALAKQPLHRILVGAGFGPRFANFYIGALWVKQQEPTTLKEGDMANPTQLNSDLRSKYKAQVTFGINVPVRGVMDAFKKKE
jgi:hypothetical protein